MLTSVLRQVTRRGYGTYPQTTALIQEVTRARIDLVTKALDYPKHPRDINGPEGLAQTNSFTRGIGILVSCVRPRNRVHDEVSEAYDTYLDAVHELTKEYKSVTDWHPWFLNQHRQTSQQSLKEYHDQTYVLRYLLDNYMFSIGCCYLEGGHLAEKASQAEFAFQLNDIATAILAGLPPKTVSRLNSVVVDAGECFVDGKPLSRLPVSLVEYSAQVSHGFRENQTPLGMLARNLVKLRNMIQ